MCGHSAVQASAGQGPTMMPFCRSRSLMRLNWRRPACSIRPRPSLWQVALLLSLPLLVPAAPVPERSAAKSALPGRVGGWLLCRRSGGASWIRRTKAPTAASVSTAGDGTAAALVPRPAGAPPTALLTGNCWPAGAGSQGASGAGLRGLKGEAAPSSSANGSTSAEQGSRRRPEGELRQPTVIGGSHRGRILPLIPQASPAEHPHPQSACCQQRWALTSFIGAAGAHVGGHGWVLQHGRRSSAAG